jgi:hypothetical protein
MSTVKLLLEKNDSFTAKITVVTPATAVPGVIRGVAAVDAVTDFLLL